MIAGWQFDGTALTMSYLSPIYLGIRQAAQDLRCNLLLACGMGPSLQLNDPSQPAWFTIADGTNFVPVGPWNTHGLIIINPYTHPLTRQDIAHYVGMSEDYLTHCFRQELGTTPVEYLNRYRVLQARHLLAESDKSITNIALEVGFSSSSYFSRVFRKEVGQSPEEYRRLKQSSVR